MKIRLISILVGISIFLSSFSLICFSEEETTTTAPDEKIECTVTLEDSFEPGVIFVVIKKEYSSPNIERTLSDFPNINAKSITNMLYLTEMDSIEVDMSKYRQLYRIDLVENTKEATLEAIAEIETLEFVRSATPNIQSEINLSINDEDDAATDNIAVTASADDTILNDSYYKEDEIELMSLEEAWKINNSSDVLIGVMDTGIDKDHPDLAGRINVGLSKNFIDDGLTAFDDVVEHGTAVASIIGAIGNNGIDSVGVCWGGANIVSLRVIEAAYNTEGKLIGIIDVMAVAYGIAHAVQNNIKILNMSFGSEAPLTWAEDWLNAYPIITICAAGNLMEGQTEADRDNDSNNFYPANFSMEHIISVASIDKMDRLSSFSYYGATKVDLAALGEDVLVLLPGNRIKNEGGTSMAAPFVTGVAALIMSLTDGALTSVQVKQCILNGTDYLPSLEGKCVTEGKLNAFRAIKNAMELGAGTTAAGDFDGDGTDEIAGFYGRGPNMALIYWQNNNSTFDLESGTVGCFSNAFNVSNIVGSVAALDYDADGADEIGALFDYGNYVGFWIFDLMGTSTFHPRLVGTTGTFSESVQFRVTSGDVDGNGREELFALYNYGNGSYYGWWIFHQGADGTFHHSRLGNTGAMAADAINGRIAGGDFDGDGRSELGILYDNYTGSYNVVQMLMLDYNNGTFSSTVVGTTDWFSYSAMKGLITAGDFDGDGVDEMMGLHGYNQGTENRSFKIWIFDRLSNGTFSYYSSDTYTQFTTAKIAYTMVSGDFNLASNREIMAGIYKYPTYCSIWGFGRPTNSTWYCHKMM